MNFKWKKLLIALIDLTLVIYLAVAVTAFNKPDVGSQTCTKLIINIEDEATNGFIKPAEISERLMAAKLHPLNKPMRYIDARKIEEKLKQSPFVKTAECYKTQNGHVYITLTQRMPIVRIKSANGDDYYLDDNDCVMPNSKYTSDLIIATGNVSRHFAANYISPMSKVIMSNNFWENQIEQINVLPDLSIELVPRVGDHIIMIGQLPEGKSKKERTKLIEDFLANKLDRIEKFYRYGLPKAGWNKYEYINVEYDNQIICTRRGTEQEAQKAKEAKEAQEKQEAQENNAAQENNTAQTAAGTPKANPKAAPMR